MGKAIITNFSDLDNNWSGEYILNRKDGKLPYVKKKGYLTEIEKGKSIPSAAIYLKKEKVDELNSIRDEINELEKKYNEILKNY